MVSNLCLNAPQLATPLMSISTLADWSKLRPHPLFSKWQDQSSWADESYTRRASLWDTQVEERLKSLRNLQTAPNAGLWLSALPSTSADKRFSAPEWQALLRHRTGSHCPRAPRPSATPVAPLWIFLVTTPFPVPQQGCIVAITGFAIPCSRFPKMPDGGQCSNQQPPQHLAQPMFCSNPQIPNLWPWTSPLSTRCVFLVHKRPVTWRLLRPLMQNLPRRGQIPSPVKQPIGCVALLVWRPPGVWARRPLNSVIAWPGPSP